MSSVRCCSATEGASPRETPPPGAVTGVEGSEVVAQDIDLADPETLEATAVEGYVADWEQKFLG